MKKLVFLLTLLIPSIAFGQAVALFKDKGASIGTLTTCTVDSNVDAAFSTTVDQDSAAAAKTLYIAATTNLVAGDTLLVDADNSNSKKEVCVVDTVNAGVSVDCVDNLTYTHTAAQADDTVLTNRLGPLSGGGYYLIQLVSAANALVAGSFVLGDQYVNGAATYGATFASVAGTTGFIVRITSDAPYVSIVSQSNDAVAKACQIR